MDLNILDQKAKQSNKSITNNFIDNLINNAYESLNLPKKEKYKNIHKQSSESINNHNKCCNDNKLLKKYIYEFRKDIDTLKNHIQVYLFLTKILIFLIGLF